MLRHHVLEGVGFSPYVDVTHHCPITLHKENVAEVQLTNGEIWEVPYWGMSHITPDDGLTQYYVYFEDDGGRIIRYAAT